MKRKLQIIAASLLILSAAGCSNSAPDLNNKDTNNSSKNDNTILYPEDFDTSSQGASSYQKLGDHKNSPYFGQIDFYNIKSTNTLTILPKFKTYQQTTEYTCGPASALMVLNYFGENNYNELEISEMMKCHQDLNGNNTEEPGIANERGEFGTSTDRMVSFFNTINWQVTSSLTEGNLPDGYSFDDSAKFKDWVISNLKNNTPIMVEWIDWAGHWSVIIGYDTMGTDSFGDDVLILADPYDTSDHLQDGYHIVPAERFFYMWFDKNLLPEDQSVQQWLIAKPNK